VGSVSQTIVIRETPGVSVCLGVPSERRVRRLASARRARAALIARLEGLEPARVTLADADQWQARFAAGPCVPPATDASAAAAAGSQPAGDAGDVARRDPAP